MNFRQLEYIIAVEKHRNFKRASIDCDVAQSTLSQEIQRLEREFDMIIFDRSRNPVVPTLKGIEIIKKAKEIRFQQNEFIQIAHNKNNDISGNINLAIAEILAPYITPHFIKEIRRKYPRLNIKIFELSDRRIEDYLINEEVDAALMMNPTLTHGYYEQKLFNDELCLYSTKHKSEDSTISINEVDFNQVLLHEDLRDLVLRQVKDLGPVSSLLQKNNIKYLKGNLETLKNIVRINGGSMFLPKMALEYIPKEEMKNIFYLKKEKLKLNVSLISTRGFEKKRIIRTLAKDLIKFNE